MRVVKTLCCAIALAAFIAPGARADEWNKLTYFTFSGPVQLPGVTLPAGTYTFKLADTLSNRHVVQVFDKDQSKIYGTFLTVADQRVRPADKPLVMFAEAPAGQPAAVQAWFYPGNTIGNEFVYSKDQAVSIAKANHEPVMAVADNSNTSDASAMKNAKIGHVDENGNITEDNDDNRAMSESGASAQAEGTTGQAPGMTTNPPNREAGLYTGAPSPANRRTGVAENSDVMNRYGRNTGTTEQPAAGGSTAVTQSPTPNTTAQSSAPTSTTAQSGTAATGTTPQSGSATGATAERNAEPAGTSGQRNQSAVGTSGQTPAPSNNAQANRANRLPKTASPLELMELLSALSLAGAFGVRQLRKRAAEAR